MKQSRGAFSCSELRKLCLFLLVLRAEGKQKVMPRIKYEKKQTKKNKQTNKRTNKRTRIKMSDVYNYFCLLLKISIHIYNA